MFSLEDIWHNQIYPGLLSEKSAGVATNSKFDDMFVQSSITFEIAPKVLFVSDIRSRKLADLYSNLPSLNYTAEEQAVMSQLEIELKVNPKFFNGDQMIVTDLVYDTFNNIIYLEAKQVKFVFIRALSLGKFAPGSLLYQQRFYKTGVLVPCITRDLYTFFVKRKADNLYSAAGGFLEPISDRLNFPENDLVVQTAARELLEEFFGIYSRVNDEDIFKPQIPISAPVISSVSFRKAGTMGTIEFVAPCRIECYKEYVVQVIKNNKAKDAHEHLTDYMLVPLDSEQREEAVKLLSAGLATYNGGFLYHPMLFDTSRLANPDAMLAAQQLPNSRSRWWPASLLTPSWDPITPKWIIQEEDLPIE